MTSVDVCSPAVAAQAPTAPPTGGEFSCAACSEAFPTAAEQRAHCKSERHVYNTKRRLAGLRPISQEAWERKLRESRGAAGTAANKGTAHLKANKGTRKAGSDNDPSSESSSVAPVAAHAAKEEDDAPWTPECCLFDRKRFPDMEACLRYMWKTYSFAVPDREYCTDVPGLLTFLSKRISQPPFACLYCNKKFEDAVSVRRHMLDKNHTRIGTQARTRRGFVDEAGSAELESQLEDFYDFHGSTREITERITDPTIKIAALLRFFDADHDGHLQQKELAKLWAAVNDGQELSEAQYQGACGRAGADPNQGLDAEALGQLYAEGLADLDAHFGVLQDLLARKLTPHRSSEACSAIPEANEESGEEGEESAEGEEEEADDDGEGSESSETEVVECEDEDEFEEVMRILGLQPATILPNGDLRLPNGAAAVHRDVAHIWRQRGQRLEQLATASGRAPKRHTPLMLGGTPAGGCQIATTRRQQVREGKRIIAVLRRQQKYEMKLGIQQNVLQTQKGLKVRTIYGDASGGR
mmetsp:Transcript_113786/g.367620  ORF Transcript_113786/g.367620 Transcript_113786/m.367620 type:complete len:526 (+) Transcript_113786:80-1657(+)